MNPSSGMVISTQTGLAPRGSWQWALTGLAALLLLGAAAAGTLFWSGRLAPDHGGNAFLALMLPFLLLGPAIASVVLFGIAFMLRARLASAGFLLAAAVFVVLALVSPMQL